MFFRAAFIAATVVLAAPSQVFAAPIELSSAIFVEKTETAADGTVSVTLTPAERVVPGDRLRFVISYANPSDEDADDFVITNPIPSSIAYLEADGPVEVSVDGKAWGQLSEFSVTADDGNIRAAQPSDVTHIRWAFNSAIPAGSSGEVLYRGELR
ncbi:MAG: hypothetical protein WA979_11490 [Pacificimonas sp.]